MLHFRPAGRHESRGAGEGPWIQIDNYDLHNNGLFVHKLFMHILWYTFTGSWNWWISTAMFTRTMQVLDGKLIIHGYFEGRGAHKSEPLCPRFLQKKSLQIPEQKEFQDLCLTVVCFNEWKLIQWCSSWVLMESVKFTLVLNLKMYVVWFQPLRERCL